MCIIDFKGNIIDANTPYLETLGRAMHDEIKGNGRSGREDEACRITNSPLDRIKKGEKEVTSEGARILDGIRRHFLIKAKPVRNAFGDLVGIIESYNDITERKRLEQDKQRLIDELRASLEQVKQLKGMLPICPSCKQVRDDKGYWEQIESYLQEHAEVEISSSLCPDCKAQAQLPLYDVMPQDQPEKGNVNNRDMQWLKVMLQ
jgi:PAS domain S-box-containing protein